MPKHLITVLGIFIAILPFLGFPNSYKAPVYFILGGGIAYLSFYEHRHRKKHPSMRRVRKSKGAVTLPVNGGSLHTRGEIQTITNLVESNEENTASR